DNLERLCISCFFFCSETAPTVIYTLSLHDALPIWAEPELHVRDLRGRQLESAGARRGDGGRRRPGGRLQPALLLRRGGPGQDPRSEEHTSELQSRENLVCRLLLEKKKKKKTSKQMR